MQDALQPIEGVLGVRASFPEGTARVTYDAGRLTHDKLVALAAARLPIPFRIAGVGAREAGE